jgi:hypothetical protein
LTQETAVEFEEMQEMQELGDEENDETEEQTQSLSVAERMWNRRRKNPVQTDMEDSIPLQGMVSTKHLPECIQRLGYVIDQIINQAPEEIRDTWQFKTVAAMVQEARKDFRRLPEDQVTEFSRSVGHAFLWVADGDMADVAAE